LSLCIVAFTNLLNQVGNQVYLVDYNKLLLNPKDTFKSISETTKLKTPENFIKYSNEIRKPTSKAKPSNDIPSGLLSIANELYSKLQKSAI